MHSHKMFVCIANKQVKNYRATSTQLLSLNFLSFQDKIQVWRAGIRKKKKTWLQLNEEKPTFQSWPAWVISWSLSALLCHFIDPFRLSHSLIAGRINSSFYPESGFKTTLTATKVAFHRRNHPWATNTNTATQNSPKYSDKHRSRAGLNIREGHHENLSNALPWWPAQKKTLQWCSKSILTCGGWIWDIPRAQHQQETLSEGKMPEWGSPSSPVPVPTTKTDWDTSEQGTGSLRNRQLHNKYPPREILPNCRQWVAGSALKHKDSDLH